jgi:hypothetical protein
MTSGRVDAGAQGRVFTTSSARIPRRGVTPVEVVVVLCVVAAFVLVALFVLPRQRETARLNGCRRNLMQIGVALSLYDQSQSHLPMVPLLDRDTSISANSPQRALLETLALSDFSGLEQGAHLTQVRHAPTPEAGIIPGFLCQSDPYAFGGGAVSPVSYRATTGDQPRGLNGAFAPGRHTRLKTIDEADGLSFTAALSERLVGTQRDNDRAAVNYAAVNAPILIARCPPLSEARWYGGAGSSWREAGWRSTLYNHAMPPNGAPSCIRENGAEAMMGASSGHTSGVNVLIFDGSVRTVTPRIDLQVWKSLSTIDSAARNDDAQTTRTR